MSEWVYLLQTNNQKHPLLLKQILKYFPNLSEQQIKQFEMLKQLYVEWNDKINVISRKDTENLYERHVLHSLSIAKFIEFKPTTNIIDIGTGGGFPGIPLAIIFPQCHFHLVDSIGKKIMVATEISRAINLTNTTLSHINAKDIKQKYDFAVSRAVMNAPDLIKISRRLINRNNKNHFPNGLICLKGGNLEEEIKNIRDTYYIKDLSDYFEEPFFETKKILYVSLTKP